MESDSEFLSRTDSCMQASSEADPVACGNGNVHE